MQLQKLSDQFSPDSENWKDGLKPKTTQPDLASFNSLIRCWYEIGWRSVPTRLTCRHWPSQGLHGVRSWTQTQWIKSAVCPADMMTSDVWMTYVGETPWLVWSVRPMQPLVAQWALFLFQLESKRGHSVLVIYHCVANDDRSATWDQTYRFLYACMAGFCGEVVQVCGTNLPGRLYSSLVWQELQRRSFWHTCSYRRRTLWLVSTCRWTKVHPAKGKCVPVLFSINNVRTDREPKPSP